jgi:hypothetical protein
MLPTHFGPKSHTNSTGFIQRAINLLRDATNLAKGKVKSTSVNKIRRFLSVMAWWKWLIIWATMLAIFSATGAASGYSSGLQIREDKLKFALSIDLQVQFTQGLADLEAGRYDMAQQRFEYIIRNQPDYPGANDQLVRIILLSAENDANQASMMPDPATLTPAPTATPDMRASDELFAAAQSLLQNQDWRNLLPTLIALRDIDPYYQAAQVDRMLFLALRYLGEVKILEDGDLESGLYDLALLEKFVILDSQARSYRDWVYLYQLGLNFWGIFPEKAVEYFSQLATVAPYLRDLSGIFAKDRFTQALILYGDYLAELGDWCGATAQYVQAQAFSDDPNLQLTAAFAESECNPPVDTPTPGQAIFTSTPTVELTPTPEITVSLESPTATLEATDSVVETASPDLTATIEETPLPSDTPESDSP